MRISQLSLLLALEKYGSFSKAAKELFLSQPYISATIKDLEDDVGFQILERSNKGVQFTLQGALVLEKAHTILDEMDAIYKLRSSAVKKGLARKLRVVGAPFFCNMILADTLAILSKEIEDFEFDLRHAQGGGLLKPFSFGDADVAVVLVSEENEIGFFAEIQRYDLKYVTLYNDSMCHIVRKDHPLCTLPEVTIADIVKYPQVFQFDSLVDFNLRIYQQHGYRGKPMIIENLVTLLRYLTVSDAVTFFVPQVFNVASYDARELTALYPTDFKSTSKVLCVYTKEMEFFVENYFLPALGQVCSSCQKIQEPHRHKLNLYKSL